MLRRERKDVMEKSYKKNISMSEEKKDKRFVAPAYRKFLPDNEIKNKDTLFYHRNIVITGTFTDYEYRNDLADLFHSFGAAVKSGISSKIDIVVMGMGAGPKKKNTTFATTYYKLRGMEIIDKQPYRKAKVRRRANAVPSDAELEARFADLSMPEYPQDDFTCKNIIEANSGKPLSTITLAILS